MGYAFMQASRRLGLTENASYATFATAGQSWLQGAVLQLASGLLVEASGTGAINTGVVGVASSPFTAAITASGGTAIGQETVPKVGAGTAISAVRRAVVPATAAQTFIGSIDTSGSQGAGSGLAVTDIGTAFRIRAVNAAGTAVASGGTWIVDRTAGGTGVAVIVVALVDPPGALVTDVPNLGAGDTGQSLVEFVFAPATVRFWG